MRNVFVLFVLILSASAMACGRGGPKAPAPLAPLTQAFVIYYDDSGGIQEALREPIRDMERYRKFWKDATARQTQPPALPAVDFEKEMVLLVAAGRMNAEDEIHVDSVGVRRELAPDGKTRDVFVAQVRVVEACRGSRTAAYPVELVRVRSFSGPVNFVERRERGEGCK